ncbi:LOW QUALITY PROTEIN: hypothetical protein U9M48_035574 [Paspalum notatum var. saurae]|uniref:Uncharacterized protein n=1 Tax=Paspalum notatum var. saurae TaxID=547442 RepID=A0AAQ3X955_PASNO
MNEVLRPFLRRFVLVFFDDILIFSKTWTEHLQHVRTVFDTLRANSLVLKKSKCFFGESSVAYLGHVVSRTGVSMDAGKVQAVVDWPTPKSVRALRGFLGLAGYYRKYVKDYGAIAAPLNHLLQKDGFQWTAQADAVFQQLKTALTTAPVLVLPNFVRLFVVECDASGAGCGVVLHQGDRPVAFFRRELIGLVQAVRHWGLFLWGRQFTVKTDHYSLKFLLDQRLSTIPQHQWVSKLLGFDFTIEYKPGHTNVAADALSRRDAEDCSSMAISGPTFDIFGDLRQAASTQPALVALTEQWTAGTLGNPWSVRDGVVLYNKLYLPPGSDLLQTVLSGIHDMAHEGVEKTLHRFRRDFHTQTRVTREWKGRERQVVQDFVRHCLVCHRNKTDHLHPAGLLLPLPVPSGVWSDISMDFVESLPKVGGKSVILTVVDCFSKYAHFIPLAHPYSAESVARVFFSEIVRLHGIPTSIVSDRDPVFTSVFWKELFTLMGTKLHMSSAFHPQSDGQTEAVNKAIGMYLRCLTGDRPRQWLLWLPWAEFVYNTAFHSSLKDTPFRVVYGRDPPAIRSYDPGESRVQAVARSMAERDELLEDARARLSQAQEVAKRAYDRSHRDVSFAVGDWDVYATERLLPCPSKSKASCVPASMDHTECWLSSMMLRTGSATAPRIHDVFHVGLLKKFVGTPPDALPPLPPMHFGAALPIPARAIKIRMARGVRQVLIQWKDQPASAATWEDVEEFQRHYPSWQLVDDLQQAGQASVEHLHINDRSLTPFISHAIEKENPLLRLVVENCDLTSIGVSKLFECLTFVKEPLDALSIAENPLGSSVATALAYFLGSHVRYLNAEDIGLGTLGFQLLEESLPVEVALFHINISKNRGGIRAAYFVSRLILQAPNLVSVNAAANLLPPESLEIICSSLKQRTCNLEQVDLTDNMHLSGNIFPGFLEFQKHGKPILVVPSTLSVCAPYDDDP